MLDEIDNETWLLDEGDRVIQAKAEGHTRLSPRDKLIYCLWTADYGMRNAGDLLAAFDVFPDFLIEGKALAAELILSVTLQLFSLEPADFQANYFNHFDVVCAELRSSPV